MMTLLRIGIAACLTLPLSCAAEVFADSMAVPGVPSFVIGQVPLTGAGYYYPPATPFSISPQTPPAFLSSATSPATFSANIGTASSGRIVAVAIVGNPNASGTVISATEAGNPMTCPSGASQQTGLDQGTQETICYAVEWRNIERRIVEDPRGGMTALTAMSSKDTLLGDNQLSQLHHDQPAHPIFTGGSVDSLHRVLRRQMYNALGREVERFRPSFFASNEVLRSTRNFIRERFGVSTGDIAAKTLSDAFGKVIESAADRVMADGKIFEPREDWRVPQPWTPRRVANLPKPSSSRISAPKWTRAA